MINEAHISLSGYVATQPYYKATRTGVPSLSMRVAWTPRWMDRVTGEWTDAQTSFLTVQVYRKLAENAATCLRKGDPVVVRGRFSVREFDDKNGVRRTRVEVDASSVGPDLSHGIATFQRVRPQTGMTAIQYQTAQDGLPGGPGEPGEPGGDGDDGAFAGLAMAAGAGGGEGTGGAGGADGPDGPDGEMFDEEAVTGLAGQAASVTAPF